MYLYRDPAIAMMKEMGQDGITVEALQQLLATPPVYKEFSGDLQ